MPFLLCLKFAFCQGQGKEGVVRELTHDFLSPLTREGQKTMYIYIYVFVPLEKDALHYFVLCKKTYSLR